ncbi:MAG: RNA polymerase sigma factor [Steroidobacteraceae bacterium]
MVALAKSGDVRAFEELVRRRQSWLRNLLRRLSGNAHLADDLAQQALLKAWCSIGSLKTNVAFGAWLRRMAVNAWVDHLRRRNPLDATDAGSDATTVGPDPIERHSVEEGLDLHRALSTLTVPVRLCIVLSYSEGMSHAEICEATGFPLGTIKSHISRGLERLQNILKIEGS